jgi:hypothetical protein
VDGIARIAGVPFERTHIEGPVGKLWFRERQCFRKGPIVPLRDVDVLQDFRACWIDTKLSASVLKSACCLSIGRSAKRLTCYSLLRWRKHR